MGSFASGFKMGGDMYDSSEESKRQKVLDDRASTVFDQGQEDRTRAVGIRSKLDDAYKAQAALANGTVAGNTADFSGTNPAADQGPIPQDQMAPVVGLRSPGSDPSAPAPGLVRTPATQMDRLNAASTIANLKQDDVGIARIGAERQVMAKNASDRTFLSRLTTMSQDPAQADAYQKEIGPVMSALNGHEGVPANYHYDPKTRSIVQTPYGSVDPKTGQATYGAPQQMPFLTVASAALAMKNLTDENGGDPAVAAEHLRTMSDGERDRRLKEADSSVKNATSLSYAASQQQQVDESGRHNRASEGIQAASARNSGGGGDKKIPAELQGKINDTIGQLNTTDDPKERKRLGLVLNNLQVSAANYQGKTIIQKPERGNDLDPAKYGAAVKSWVDMGMTLPDATAKVDTMLGRGPGQGMNPASSTDPYNAANAGKQSNAAAKPTPAEASVATARTKLGRPVSNDPVPEPPQQYRNVGLTRVANPDFQNWQQTYGDEYARQQAYAPTLDERYRAGMDASRSAGQVAPSGYNPYIQNRVR